MCCKHVEPIPLPVLRIYKKLDTLGKLLAQGCCNLQAAMHLSVGRWAKDESWLCCGLDLHVLHMQCPNRNPAPPARTLAMDKATVRKSSPVTLENCLACVH